MESIKSKYLTHSVCFFEGIAAIGVYVWFINSGCAAIEFTGCYGAVGFNGYSHGLFLHCFTEICNKLFFGKRVSSMKLSDDIVFV